jgi:hypothetical protein
MRLLILLAAITIPSASTPAQAPPAEPPRVKPLDTNSPRARADCRRADLHPADSRSKGRFNRLGELPSGQLVLTVYREVGGCPDPVIVRHGYGLGEPAEERARPEQPRPKTRRW